jgi:hypothetical protein
MYISKSFSKCSAGLKSFFFGYHQLESTFVLSQCSKKIQKDDPFRKKKLEKEFEKCVVKKKIPKQKNRKPKNVLFLNYIDVTRGYRVISKIFSLFAYCLWEITNLI